MKSLDHDMQNLFVSIYSLASMQIGLYNPFTIEQSNQWLKVAKKSWTIRLILSVMTLNESLLRAFSFKKNPET
jgi:hypothetical protein